MIFSPLFLFDSHQKQKQKELSKLKVPSDVERQFGMEFSNNEKLEKIIEEKLESAFDQEEPCLYCRFWTCNSKIRRLDPFITSCPTFLCCEMQQ